MGPGSSPAAWRICFSCRTSLPSSPGTEGAEERNGARLGDGVATSKANMAWPAWVVESSAGIDRGDQTLRRRRDVADRLAGEGAVQGHGGLERPSLDRVEDDHLWFVGGAGPADLGGGHHATGHDHGGHDGADDLGPPRQVLVHAIVSRPRSGQVLPFCARATQACRSGLDSRFWPGGGFSWTVPPARAAEGEERHPWRRRRWGDRPSRARSCRRAT